MSKITIMFSGEDIRSNVSRVKYILVCSSPKLGYIRLCTNQFGLRMSKVSGLVRLCALIIHVYPCLCRDSDGLKSSTSHPVTHGATHCAQGHMLHPWGRNPLFNKNQMSQVTLLVDIGSCERTTCRYDCWGTT